MPTTCGACGTCENCARAASITIADRVIQQQRRRKHTYPTASESQRTLLVNKVASLLVILGIAEEKDLADGDPELAAWGQAMRQRQVDTPPR